MPSCKEICSFLVCTAFWHFNLVEMRLFYVGVASFKSIITDGSYEMVLDEISGRELENRCSEQLSSSSFTALQCVQALESEVQMATLLTPPWRIKSAKGNIRGQQYFGQATFFYFSVSLVAAFAIRCNIELYKSKARDYDTGKYLAFTFRLPRDLTYIRCVKCFVLIGGGMISFMIIVAILHAVYPNMGQPNIKAPVVKMVSPASFVLFLTAYGLLRPVHIGFDWQSTYFAQFKLDREFSAIFSESNERFANNLAHAILKAEWTDNKPKWYDSVCNDADRFRDLRNICRGQAPSGHRPLQ